MPIPQVTSLLGTGRPTERIRDPGFGPSGVNSPQERGSWTADGRGGNTRLTKLDFPSFDGSKPRCWVRRCEHYFTIFAIPDWQKVEIASMHVTGNADVWLQGFMVQHPGLSWSSFMEAVCARFGEHLGSDIVAEFNKLEQKDSLEDYADRFEELKAYMLAYDSRFPESYFVSSFISGLRGEIKSLVQMGRPNTLALAYEQAKLHNETVHAIVKLNTTPWRPGIQGNTFKNSCFEGEIPPKPVNSSPPPSATGSLQCPPSTLNSESREARRSAGLCYKCSDKYFVGQRCKIQSIHSLLASQLESQQIDSGMVSSCKEDMGTEIPEGEPEVYIHALTGSNPLTTIRIKGKANGKELTILIDSGATHSFINPRIVKEANIDLQDTNVMDVVVANGSKMFSSQLCQDFEWLMQGTSFRFCPRVLKLGGRDMVLGGDWLCEYNPVLLVLKQLKMSIIKDGKHVEICGVTEQATLKVMSGMKLRQWFRSGVSCCYH